MGGPILPEKYLANVLSTVSKSWKRAHGRAKNTMTQHKNMKPTVAAPPGCRLFCLPAPPRGAPPTARPRHPSPRRRPRRFPRGAGDERVRASWVSAGPAPESARCGRLGGARSRVPSAGRGSAARPRGITLPRRAALLRPAGRRGIPAVGPDEVGGGVKGRQVVGVVGLAGERAAWATGRARPRG